LIEKEIDFGITIAEFRSDVGAVVDYTDFVSINEVIFNVCGPQRLTGIYNIFRPFG
jgi:hypothetical protein